MTHAADLIQSVEYQSMQKAGEGRPELQPGDTVNVHVRIVEGNRERVQTFQGVVIGIKGAASTSSLPFAVLPRTGLAWNAASLITRRVLRKLKSCATLKCAALNFTFYANAVVRQPD
jgi:hypothetical protein